MRISVLVCTPKKILSVVQNLPTITHIRKTAHFSKYNIAKKNKKTIEISVPHSNYPNLIKKEVSIY
jgi:hypothetical protein